MHGAAKEKKSRLTCNHPPHLRVLSGNSGPSYAPVAKKRSPEEKPQQRKKIRKRSVDDSQLVEQLKRGSEEAFEELFERHRDKVFNVVFRILGDVTECEDVVQEAFLKALRNIHSFHGNSAFYTWLYRIAVNAAVDFRKKLRPRGVVSIHRKDGTTQEVTSQADGPVKIEQRREMAGLLRETMNELTEKHRSILILREFQGLSYIEISEVLGCSKGTVESRLFRARHSLREKMERYM